MIGCVEEAIVALELLLDKDAVGLTTLEAHLWKMLFIVSLRISRQAKDLK